MTNGSDTPGGPEQPADSDLAERFLRNAEVLGLDEESAEDLLHVCVALALWIRTHRTEGRCYVLGVNGAQGSGKSTLCALLTRMLIEYYGLHAVHLSLDDFYLSRAERERMARDVHPLFRTRGVPGTHDMARALNVIWGLRSGKDVQLPRFDKASDDLLPEEEWPIHTGQADIVLFEGWCVGARPEPAERLENPVNELESAEDAQGIWRRAVNRRLESGVYRALFDGIESLVMLHAPDLEAVAGWRTQQERALHAVRGDEAGITSEEEMHRFLMHYERLTRYMLEEMPSRADVVMYLDSDHRFERVKVTGPRA